MSEIVVNVLNSASMNPKNIGVGTVFPTNAGALAIGSSKSTSSGCGFPSLSVRKQFFPWVVDATQVRSLANHQH
jgi:hypothetical protein